MIDIAFIEACSTRDVHPRTVQEIIRVESDGDENAINVNAKHLGFKKPATKEQAIDIAQSLISKGYSIDMGLMQINSANLEKMNLTVADAFDPCKNIRTGTQILKDNYGRASTLLGPGQEALKAALSAYNTGNFHSGGSYVAKFFGSARDSYDADISVNFSLDTNEDLADISRGQP